MLERISLFDLVGRRLAFAEQRHMVLTRNIANADTPGYRAQDVKQPDFGAMVAARAGAGRVELARSHDGHRLPASNGTEGPHRVRDAKVAVTVSGNAVNLEEEAGKLASNAGQHGRAMAVYGKYISFLKLAVGASA
ncbi:MAG: flagellar biosynthesis protein FlgB [Pseudomonadota bacterium]